VKERRSLASVIQFLQSPNAISTDDVFTIATAKSVRVQYSTTFGKPSFSFRKALLTFAHNQSGTLRGQFVYIVQL